MADPLSKQPAPAKDEIETPSERSLDPIGEKDAIGKEITPTSEELASLRHVPGSIPKVILAIAFVEMCERLSYCGTVIVCESLLGELLDSTHRSNSCQLCAAEASGRK